VPARRTGPRTESPWHPEEIGKLLLTGAGRLKVGAVLGGIGVEFLLLGPFEASHDGTRVDVGRRRERCLLAVLLLEPGQVLSVERLTDLLWEDDPPARVRASLHVHVSRLRSRLDPAGDGALGVRLLTTEGGYRVDVAPERVDAHRFLALVHRAGAEPAAATRAALLRRAVGMWRGPCPPRHRRYRHNCPLPWPGSPGGAPC
jgi:DNA-binding winged helix-turn-helix (wHTH) protein